VPSEYVTETELTNKGYATTSSVNTALGGKVDKVTGKQLSTEDFTTALKNKLSSLNNYDDTAINQSVQSLQAQLNTLVSGNASSAVESFNEIIAFLEGIEDSQSLDSIIASIEQQIAGKMDNVTLAAVATSGNYNDLSNKPTIPSAVTESTVNGWGFTKNTGTYSKPSNGIPKTDLESSVQSSLNKADTALQTEQYKGTYSKPSGGIPKSDLASAVQTSLGKADTALQTETDPTVPSWAKAASKPTYTASEVGAVPTTRKVNGKALSTDITLSASDVSALPNTTVIPTKVSQLTNDSNFTSNTGTITGITMNGTSKGTSGVVNLGTVITAHQDISGKQDKLVSGTNIKTVNGTSLLGSGNVEINTNLSTPIVNHGTSDTSFALTPNVYHRWGTVSSLSLTLATPSDQTILNEYMFEFVSGSTATSLSLPSTVKWTSELSIEPNKTYQVSILDGLGVIGGF
jgi:hypothetical protein